MENKIKEYVSLLFKALKVSDKEYLFVDLSKVANKYKNLILEEAKNYNLKEVYINIIDDVKKHELLKTLSQEEINNHPLFDNSIRNDYAKKDAAFMFLLSDIPNLMNDIEASKIKETRIHVRETEKYFRDLYENNKLYWLIACIPNDLWAKDLNLTTEELWDLILKCSLVNGDNTSYKKWNEKLDLLDKRSKILNSYQFEYLEYHNSKGTNLRIYLPDNHIWCSGKTKDGYICNLPTEEMFVSPLYNKTEGIVYSTKPILYNNILIEDFFIKVKDGKVIDFDAKVGKDILETIITTDEYSCFLGEAALVSYNSPINNTGVIFKETLYDENASCHLALGAGFNECVKGGEDVSDDELRTLGVNVSKTHVDFMIGSADLSVIGVKKDGAKVPIIENGDIII